MPDSTPNPPAAPRYDETLILDYVEGQLTQTRALEFEKQMLADPRLRNLVAQLVLDRVYLHQLPREKAPPHLMDTVNQQLERNMLLEAPAPTTLSTAVPRGWLALRGVVYAGIAAMVMLCVSLFYLALTDFNLIRKANELAMAPPATSPTAKDLEGSGAVAMDDTRSAEAQASAAPAPARTERETAGDVRTPATPPRPVGLAKSDASAPGSAASVTAQADTPSAGLDLASGPAVTSLGVENQFARIGKRSAGDALVDMPMASARHAAPLASVDTAPASPAAPAPAAVAPTAPAPGTTPAPELAAAEPALPAPDAETATDGLARADEATPLAEEVEQEDKSPIVDHMRVQLASGDVPATRKQVLQWALENNATAIVTETPAPAAGAALNTSPARQSQVTLRLPPEQVPRLLAHLSGQRGQSVQVMPPTHTASVRANANKKARLASEPRAKPSNVFASKSEAAPRQRDLNEAVLDLIEEAQRRAGRAAEPEESALSPTPEPPLQPDEKDADEAAVEPALTLGYVPWGAILGQQLPVDHASPVGPPPSTITVHIELQPQAPAPATP